ncbi:MAG: bifunctional 4-hydroxy-2-oxoglutarate aldolase/2-dehydro-3-deoxy-phosphogluconate aldolase [Bacteroidota bacterium]
MSTFSRIEVAQTMYQTGLVPLFYHPEVEVICQVVEACYKGGARIFEFTNRGDFAHEVFGPLNKYCRKHLPEMILGVGSISDAPTASLYMQMGANFIVSASLREDVAKICNRRKIMYAPGCGTLTEIGRAEELGCELVKLFPGSTYGPGFIKGIKGPQPWTSIMPTGGVSPTEENLKAWFDAGASCVGMGSKLMKKTAEGKLDYAAIEELTRASLGIIKKVRA